MSISPDTHSHIYNLVVAGDERKKVKGLDTSEAGKTQAGAPAKGPTAPADKLETSSGVAGQENQENPATENIVLAPPQDVPGAFGEVSVGGAIAVALKAATDAAEEAAKDAAKAAFDAAAAARNAGGPIASAAPGGPSGPNKNSNLEIFARMVGFCAETMIAALLREVGVMLREVTRESGQERVEDMKLIRESALLAKSETLAAGQMEAAEHRTAAASAFAQAAVAAGSLAYSVGASRYQKSKTDIESKKIENKKMTTENDQLQHTHAEQAPQQAPAAGAAPPTSKQLHPESKAFLKERGITVEKKNAATGATEKKDIETVEDRDMAIKQRTEKIETNKSDITTKSSAITRSVTDQATLMSQVLNNLIKGTEETYKANIALIKSQHQAQAELINKTIPQFEAVLQAAKSSAEAAEQVFQALMQGVGELKALASWSNRA